jgi:hypothetical protein
MEIKRRKFLFKQKGEWVILLGCVIPYMSTNAKAFGIQKI